MGEIAQKMSTGSSGGGSGHVQGNRQLVAKQVVTPGRKKAASGCSRATSGKVSGS